MQYKEKIEKENVYYSTRISNLKRTFDAKNYTPTSH